jgi:hypothetical protein
VIVFSNSLPIVEGNLSRDRLLLIDTSRLPPEFLQLGPLPPHQNPEQACTPRLFDWAYRASSDPDIVSGGAFTSPSGSAPTPQAAPQLVPAGTDNFSLGTGNSEGNGPTSNKSESSISEQATACAHHDDGLEDDWEALLNASPPRPGNELSGDTGITSQPPSGPRPVHDESNQPTTCEFNASLDIDASHNWQHYDHDLDLDLDVTSSLELATHVEPAGMISPVVAMPPGSPVITSNSTVDLDSLQNMVAKVFNDVTIPNERVAIIARSTWAEPQAKSVHQVKLQPPANHGQPSGTKAATHQCPAALPASKRPKTAGRELGTRRRAIAPVGSSTNPGMIYGLRRREAAAATT